MEGQDLSREQIQNPFEQAARNLYAICDYDSNHRFIELAKLSGILIWRHADSSLSSISPGIRFL